MLASSGKQAVDDSPAFIPLSQLQRMRQSTTIKTEEDVAAERREAGRRQEERLRAARERKARMLRLEQERRKSAPPSKREQEKAAALAALRKKASADMDETLDDVKAMNQMMEYAKCVAIRDQQVKEKVSV